MVDRREFMIRARIESATLDVFIAEEWVIPQRQSGAEAFSDADVARANLIRDLKADIGVNDEGIGVILHLIDQLHGVRRTLRDVLKRSPPALDRD
ncbi:chaperone modulator CbpM [Methylocella silvestris]|uniref:MerR family transcriptional regulator n=1 Tax=Methylocella silvestris TaxID=199596 RepID=A0A2J7TMT3_METSI|nr:chaperone modulator CbpM [Methylocella silvestris]PNG28070.1 hypothetical protein CR492_03260 [Methylocella silvestris]